MGFDIGGALSGAAQGGAVGGPWGAVIGGAAGGFMGGHGGGGTSSGYGNLGTEQKLALDKLRHQLYGDASDSAFSPDFQYWGQGKLENWRTQLQGAAQQASNPILRAVSDQVESDFARRGLTTGGAAGAAKARGLMDIAAKIALPIEQQLVSAEQQGIQGKYGLQQYALNLALGQSPAVTGAGPVQSPYTPTAFQGILDSGVIGKLGGLNWGGGGSSLQSMRDTAVSEGGLDPKFFGSLAGG